MKAYASNIKCGNCIEKVTPKLNALAGENKWKVDLSSPQRLLTLEVDLDENAINEALKEVGYSVKPAE